MTKTNQNQKGKAITMNHLVVLSNEEKVYCMESNNRHGDQKKHLSIMFLLEKKLDKVFAKLEMVEQSTGNKMPRELVEELVDVKFGRFNGHGYEVQFNINRCFTIKKHMQGWKTSLDSVVVPRVCVYENKELVCEIDGSPLEVKTKRKTLRIKGSVMYANEVKQRMEVQRRGRELTFNASLALLDGKKTFQEIVEGFNSKLSKQYPHINVTISGNSLCMSLFLVKCFEDLDMTTEEAMEKWCEQNTKAPMVDYNPHKRKMQAVCGLVELQEVRKVLKVSDFI